MKISMPRGDIRNVQFTVTDKNGKTFDTDFTEIYFTCKKFFSDRDYLFQKSLSGETIIKEADGVYRFTIESADTDYLDFGVYVFDIELVYGDKIKQTIVGTLTLTNEATHVRNERET